MKKFISFLAICLMAGTVILSAQDYKQLAKERAEIRKLSEKELNKKASKEARKEAKNLKKQGWIVAPGLAPLEKQLDRSYLMQYEFDEIGYPRYIMGGAMSIGENYDAAKMQALELAKLDLASKIQTEVTGLVENALANKQLAAEEAVSVLKTISASKSLISQKLGRLVVPVECYRVLPNKNKEVRVQTAYNSAMAHAAAKAALRDQLEGESEDLLNRLDSIIDSTCPVK